MVVTTVAVAATKTTAVMAMAGGTDNRQQSTKRGLEETTGIATETETATEMVKVTATITMPTLTPTTANQRQQQGRIHLGCASRWWRWRCWWRDVERSTVPTLLPGRGK
jgi:hypothetical protein